MIELVNYGDSLSIKVLRWHKLRVVQLTILALFEPAHDIAIYRAYIENLHECSCFIEFIKRVGEKR